MAYPTTTEHHKVYPWTSVMASPYSCDNTGVLDIAASIELLKAYMSSTGDLFFPEGTYKVETNLTIPVGMNLIGPSAVISIAAGITLTINCNLNDLTPTFVIANTGKLIINTNFQPGANRKYFTDNNTDYDGVELPYNDHARLEWWGGIPASTISGIATAADCYAALFCAINSLAGSSYNASAVINLGKGIYRFAQKLEINPSSPTAAWGLTIQGVKMNKSFIYVEVTAATDDAVKFGYDTSTYHLFLKDLTVWSPNTCVNVVNLDHCQLTRLNNVNAYGDATEYGWLFTGCTDVIGENVRVQTDSSIDTAGYSYHPENGIRIEREDAPNLYAANNFHLKDVSINLYHTGGTNGALGIYVDGSNNAGTTPGYNITLENINVENYTDHAIKGYGWQYGKISTVSGEGHADEKGIYLESCRNIELDRLYLAANSPDHLLSLIASESISVNNSALGKISIDADCRGTVIGGSVIINSSIADLAPDTEYLAGIIRRDGTAGSRPFFDNYGQNRTNYIENYYFDRWTATAPDKWTLGANATATQCGTGLGDTTRNKTAYCMKLTQATAAASSYMTLPSDTVWACRGQKVSFSLWVKINAAEVFSSYPYIYLQCSGGASNPNFNNSSTFPLAAANIGVWTKVTATIPFIPEDITGIAAGIYMYLQSTPATSNVYIAEPTLLVGQPSRSIHPGFKDSPDFLQIGGLRIYVGGAAPSTAGVYYRQGDRCLNTAASTGASPGWVCITSGVGALAVWEAEAVTS